MGGKEVGTRWSRREKGLPSLGGVVNVSDVGKVARELNQALYSREMGILSSFEPDVIWKVKMLGADDQGSGKALGTYLGT